MKSIVIASHYKNVNQSLENTICLIKKGYTFTTVTDEAALGAALKKETPCILCFDAHFVKSASAYLVALLHRQYKNMRIIVFELKERTPFQASRFILFGAESYFCKRYGSELYHREISAALNGEQYIPDYVQSVLDDVKTTAPQSFKFGRRQKEMLQLLVKHDADYKAVAAKIGSVRTVRNNISMMYAKSGVRKLSELLVFAMNRGFIGEGFFTEFSADSESGLPSGIADYRPKLPPLGFR
jgi:DNA-binding NarL/FixJ family response regulator